MVIGDMWIFRRHRHLKSELLSEYLDGRLGGAAQSRVSREVARCQSCREEMESLRSTVALLRELPELVPRRSFTLSAPPAPIPVTARPPLPLRAPGWAYAGAASLAGLALAVLVSADTLGLLAPTGQTDFSRQSSEGPAQTLEFAAAPESSSTTAEDNSETPMASSEAYDAAPPDLTPAPGADSMQSLRSEESLPESSEAGPALAQPPAETDAETMALPAQPGSEEAGTAGRASGAAESTEPANDGNSLTEKAGQSSESETELSNEGPAEGRSDSGAVLTPGQYQDTPWVWRALEGVAAALLLALLGVMVVRRVMSRRTGS